MLTKHAQVIFQCSRCLKLPERVYFASFCVSIDPKTQHFEIRTKDVAIQTKEWIMIMYVIRPLYSACQKQIILLPYCKYRLHFSVGNVRVW